MALLQIVGWACLGMMFRKWGWLRQEWEGKLLKVVIWFFYPCLIVKNVMVNQAVTRDVGTLATVLGCGFCTVAVGHFIAAAVARKMPFGEVRQRNTFIFTVGIFNYGYFAFPVCRGLFGEETFGVLLVYAVGVELAIWSVGILFLAAGLGKFEPRKLLNPPLVSLCVALALNWWGVANALPQVASGLLGMAGEISIPMGLLLIGAALYDHLGELDLRKHAGLVLAGVVLRNGVIPTAFVLAAMALPVIPELKAALVVEAAMPCGIFPMLIARHYGGSATTAIQLIMGTTLVSLLTLPLWVLLGIKLAGMEPWLAGANCNPQIDIIHWP
jgi:predicted permease